MSLARHVLPFSLAAIALAACASAAPPAGRGFVLVPGQGIELGAGLSLAYDSFSDSRCPPDVKCVWAGKLSYRFIVRGAGTSDAFTLGPGQNSYAPAALHGQRIVLDESRIPPPRQSQAAPTIHSVTLKVEAK